MYTSMNWYAQFYNFINSNDYRDFENEISKFIYNSSEIGELMGFFLGDSYCRRKVEKIRNQETSIKEIADFFNNIGADIEKNSWMNERETINTEYSILKEEFYNMMVARDKQIKNDMLDALQLNKEYIDKIKGIKCRRYDYFIKNILVYFNIMELRTYFPICQISLYVNEICDNCCYLSSKYSDDTLKNDILTYIEHTTNAIHEATNRYRNGSDLVLAINKWYAYASTELNKKCYIIDPDGGISLLRERLKELRTLDHELTIRSNINSAKTDAMRVLNKHYFPDMIRELKNVVETIPRECLKCDKDTFIHEGISYFESIVNVLVEEKDRNFGNIHLARMIFHACSEMNKVIEKFSYEPEVVEAVSKLSVNVSKLNNYAKEYGKLEKMKYVDGDKYPI